MGIYGALSTAVTGLRAQSFALENISGNIANSQTTGFKRFDTDFLDLIPDQPTKIQTSGSVIAQSQSTNTQQGDVKSVNKEIDRLDSLPPDQALSASTNAAWAKVDKTLIVDHAAVAPYLNGILTSFFSSQMNVACDIFTDSQDDPAQFCMK